MASKNSLFKTNVLLGLLTIAMGVLVMSKVSGVFGPRKSPPDAPLWVRICGGLVFAAAGFVVNVHSITGNMDTPL